MLEQRRRFVMAIGGLQPTDEGEPEYEVSYATSAQFGGYTLVHEHHKNPEEQGYRHRATLTIPGTDFSKSGHWVDENGMSYVEHNGQKYLVATDLWSPMFPEFFQACGPYADSHTTDISATQAAFEDTEPTAERSSN
jgi:hypothetical protein